MANFYMTGKGSELLSGSKNFYDDLGNEIGSAEFMNGELDKAHCTSFRFSKSETEVTGEEDEAQTITTGYEKEINPSSYTEEVDPANFYDQFNDSVLSETITKNVTDAEGSTLSQTTTYLRGKNKTETVTTYENDDFGRTIKENTIQKKYQDGRWLPSYETEVSYTYDENGNVTETETKSRKEGETDWQTQKTKAVYDSKGQVTKEYSPRGVKENVAAAYTYDLLGRKVKEELPQNKTDGSAGYQTVVNEYDKSGNLVETKEQIEGDKNKEIEYTYDKQGNLVQVKSSLENEKAQYVQYVYDEQGNKVRQFTGMTGPLTVTVAAVENAKDDAGKDTFTYGGKTYAVLVTGKKKSDTIRETKYVYDTKNRLVSYTDPEGRTETYTYDCNSNLTKTVDKNGNTLKNTYDNKNRLTERTAKEKKTGKETVHTYRYNAYGDVAVQDDTQFVYGDVSGQVTKETTKLTKNKDVVKNYTYDSKGNKSTFSVKAGEDTKLSLSYEYDGSSRLISVKDSEGKQAVSYAYDTEGSLSERQAANGLKTTYGYDYQNRLTSMTNETGKGVVSKYSSTYLKNGQKAEEVSTVMDKNGKSTKKTAAYTYDMLGRITRETKTGREDISYTYDANNNRKQMTIGNKTTAYQYNKNDELLRTDTLHTDTEKNDVVIYKNDKNGNQLATVNRSEIPAEAKDTSYIDVDVTLGDNQLNDNVVNHYNALNQLTETLTKNYKVSFTYDAEGLRTSKTVNGKKTVFIWDGNQLVMELSESGIVKKRYIRGNDLVYVDKEADKDSGKFEDKQYYVTDSHGNVVQLTNVDGKIIKTYEYDSFGNEVNLDKKDDNPFRYCGEYYDKETEEIYLRARYYQPTVGRFLTRDTYTGESGDPLSLHLYTYCGNDGMNKCDADGNAWTWIKNKWNAFCDTAQKCYNGAKTYVKKTAAKVIRGGVNYWKKTWLGKEFYKRTKSGSDWKVNLLLKLGGFEREKGKSIFHARDICIQKLGGYNNFYDFVFDSATNISKPLKYKFTDRKDYKFNMKRKYVIWAWKGDYLNLGAGCEVGFYNTYGSTKHYFFVKKIFTELEMRYNGNLINNYRPPKSKGEKVGHSWWITTFNAGMQNNVNPSKIGFRCVADLSVLKAYARKALERRLEKSKRWNVEGNKATLKWNY